MSRPSDLPASPRPRRRNDGAPPLPRALTDDGITFAFSLDTMLFATTDPADRLYFFGGELHFELPDGCIVELVTGGVPPIQSIRIQAQVIGSQAKACLHSHAADGTVSCVSRPLRTGRTIVTSDTDAATTSRVGLSLAGSGQIAFESFKCGNVQPAAPSTPGTERDPLADLVRTDYEVARRAGAEIPRPSLADI